MTNKNRKRGELSPYNDFTVQPVSETVTFFELSLKQDQKCIVFQITLGLEAIEELWKTLQAHLKKKIRSIANAFLN